MSRNIKKILWYVAVYIVLVLQIYFFADSIHGLGLRKVLYNQFPWAWIYGTPIVSIGLLVALKKEYPN